MRRKTLVIGLIMLVIGLFILIIGGIAYGNVAEKAQWANMYDNIWELGGFESHTSSQYAGTLMFWSWFTFIGLILFIIGIIVSIAGGVLKEKILPIAPVTQPINQKEVEKQVQAKTNVQKKYCTECGFKNKQDAKFCVECGKNF